jgi:hypothetical protein
LSEKINAIYNLNSAAFAAFYLQCKETDKAVSKDGSAVLLPRARLPVTAGDLLIRGAKMGGKTNFIFRVRTARRHHDDMILKIGTVLHGKFALAFDWLHHHFLQKDFCLLSAEKMILCAYSSFFGSA